MKVDLPRPWSVLVGPNHAIQILGPDGFSIARVNDITAVASAQDLPDARLISAAPELLDSLKDLMKCQQEFDTCAGAVQSYAGTQIPSKTREYFRAAKIAYTKAWNASLAAIAKAEGKPTL